MRRARARSYCSRREAPRTPPGRGGASPARKSDGASSAGGSNGASSQPPFLSFEERSDENPAQSGGASYQPLILELTGSSRFRSNGKERVVAATFYCSRELRGAPSRELSTADATSHPIVLASARTVTGATVVAPYRSRATARELSTVDATPHVAVLASARTVTR